MDTTSTATPSAAPVTSAPAPAATSSASSSTPSTATAQASSPVSTTPSASSASTNAESTPAVTKSLEEQLSEKMIAGFEKPKEAPAVEAVAEVAEQLPATDEVVNESEPTEVTEDGEPSGEGDGSEEPAKPTDAEGQEEIPELDFDTPEALGPKDLAAKLDATPEVKELLEQNPELRDQIFANARLADKAKEYNEIFGSPAEARIVAEGHQAFTGISNLLGEVKPGDPQSTQSVISAMLAQATLRDANGEVMKDGAGHPITNGVVGRFLNNTFQMRLGMLEAQAKQKGDDETLAALDTIMERAGLRAPSSADEDDLSEELKAQKTQIEQERQQLDQRKAEEQQQAQKTYEDNVFGKIDGVLDRQITTILDRATGLTDFTRKGAEAAIRKGLNAALKKNSAFQSELDLIERMPIGKERARGHVALASRYIQDHLLTVARPILAEAGASIQKAAQAKAEKQTARAEAAQSEIRGSHPAPKVQPTDNASLTKQITADLTTKLGHAPTMEQLLAEKMSRGFAAAGAR